jgi:hypothetical protein
MRIFEMVLPYGISTCLLIDEVEIVASLTHCLNIWINTEISAKSAQLQLQEQIGATYIYLWPYKF